MTDMVEYRGQTNADAYRASTDAAGMCGEIVKRTARNIQGRRYVCVEGWQALAIAHGCTASSEDVERVLDEGASGYRAQGVVRRMSDGGVIARAEGFLGDDETMWAKRPVYARRAMVQTRAISRACRSAFAHVVVMIDSGLSTTPAEEVPDQGFGDVEEFPGDRIQRERAAASKSSAQARRDGDWEAFTAEIKTCRNVEDLQAWGKRRAADIAALPRQWRDLLRQEYADRQKVLTDFTVDEDGVVSEAAAALDAGYREVMAA